MGANVDRAVTWDGVSALDGTLPFYYLGCNDTTVDYPLAYTGFCYQRRFVMGITCVLVF